MFNRHLALALNAFTCHQHTFKNKLKAFQPILVPFNCILNAFNDIQAGQTGRTGRTPAGRTGRQAGHLQAGQAGRQTGRQADRQTDGPPKGNNYEGR